MFSGETLTHTLNADTHTHTRLHHPYIVWRRRAEVRDADHGTDVLLMEVGGWVEVREVGGACHRRLSLAPPHLRGRGRGL